MTTALAQPQRFLVSGREAAVRSAIELAERGWLPDALVRAGIRSFVRERLVEQETAGLPIERFAATLRSMPIAIDTGLANEQHYEVPSALFAHMLGPRLKYSSAYWPPGVSTLADAEQAMLSLTCKRAGIEDGMTVLDLGCGWGSFALWLAERQPRTRIVCASNSFSQKRYIERRAAELGLDNVRVVTADINRLELDTRFDRIVSVEMFEHVRNYDLLLGRVARWLAPGGALFVHIFCHRKYAYLYEEAGASDWMAREFFSGGTMPSFDLLDRFDDDMRIRNRWWIDGTHYARTCEAWLRNLDANEAEITRVLEEAGAPIGGKRAFHRWRIFVLACAEMFAFDGGNQWGVGHYLLSDNLLTGRPS
jgi:cyclopropane-fatty-acyl-phospholipid synthase